MEAPIKTIIFIIPPTTGLFMDWSIFEKSVYELHMIKIAKLHDSLSHYLVWWDKVKR